LEKQTEVATGLRSLLPHSLAVAAATSPAPIRSLLILLALTAFVAVIALWTFTLTLQPPTSKRSQRVFGLTQLPGRLGGLLRKDLRYSSRLLDIYLAFPIIVLFNLFLSSERIAFAIVIAVLFLPCVSIAFNCFGLDSALGFDRYTLLPLSGKEKLLGKNLAFALMMFALLAATLPLAWWTLGSRVILLGLLEFFALVLACLFCGNWFSVKQPFRMQFYRFASGGSIVDTIIGIIVASAPGALAVYLFAVEDPGVDWKLAGAVLVFLALYLFSLSRSARVLENQHEQIRRVLS
jgi:hypothetical protein